MGSGREVFTRKYSLLNELEHYAKLRDNFVPGSPSPSTYQSGYKTVSIDSDGREMVVFTNSEGQTLATCQSDVSYPESTLNGTAHAWLGDKKYQEIHLSSSAASSGLVPVSINLVGFTISGQLRPAEIKITDLRGSGLPQVITGIGPQVLQLPPSCYRIEAVFAGVNFSYPVRYGHFSYSFYNDQGINVATIAPKGVAEILPADISSGLDATPNFVTVSSYDSRGQVLAITDPDRGRSAFVYQQDGKLRFSQSAAQAQTGSFSYLNYDRLGRILETGECAAGLLTFEEHSTTTPATNSVLHNTILENRTRAGGLPAAACSQRRSIWYDRPFQDAPLGTDRVQQFVLGAVAKTAYDGTTTWFSYDEFGKVSWVVQDLPGVGVKTLDYTYDFLGNLLEVAYQKGEPDAFFHHYEYDADQRLSRAYTSIDGITKSLLAHYLYYLHGPLKRVEIADPLQAIDYAYTIQGWLKSINQPNAAADLTPDGPATTGIPADLFAAQLTYFPNDYTSRQVPTASTPRNLPGTPQYNGTIWANHWKTPSTPDIRMYGYQYDPKNQLTQADFGTLEPNSITFQPHPANAYAEGNLSYWGGPV